MIVDSELLDNSKDRDKIWREQIRRIEKNSTQSNIISLLVAILLALVLWRDGPHNVIIFWLVYMSLVTLARVVMSYSKKDDESSLTYDVFGKWYFLAILMTAIGWGVGGFLLFPVNPINQLILGFVLAGIASGGVSVMSPIAKLYYVYLFLVISPVTLRLAMMGNEFTMLAITTVFYMLVMASTGSRINKNFLTSLEVRFHNESLIKFMSQARNDSEDLNVELSTEIEQRKRIEKELQKAKQAAEAASKTKSEFLANMSHEIRTPMNGILGTLQLLQGSELTESQIEYVGIAYNSGEALLSLLNDILDFSKIEAGKLKLEYTPFNLQKLIKELTILQKQKAEEREVQLFIDTDPDIPQIIKGDSVRIRQILANLMTNAIKFTEQGTVTIKSSVLEKTQKSVRLRLEINDTGIGITEEAQRKLFNSFTQADGSTTRKYGGTGLGLAIVRQLVTLMRGRLGVKSEENKGSCFWTEITFEIPSEIEIKNPQETKIQEVINLQGKALVVEDNPVNQIIAKKMLEKVGMTYELVNNGEEAINRLKSPHDFDLVLMDCQMPVMDGYAATKELRDLEKNNDISRLPVIAMTANAMEGDKDKCLAAGMDDYVSKPVNQKALKETLAKWL